MCMLLLQFPKLTHIQRIKYVLNNQGAVSCLQVLFEENAFPADASAHLFNVRPSVASLDRAILAFIFRNRWRRIAIVHSGVGVYHQVSHYYDICIYQEVSYPRCIVSITKWVTNAI